MPQAIISKLLPGEDWPFVICILKSSIQVLVEMSISQCEASTVLCNFWPKPKSGGKNISCHRNSQTQFESFTIYFLAVDSIKICDSKVKLKMFCPILLHKLDTNPDGSAGAARAMLISKKTTTGTRYFILSFSNQTKCKFKYKFPFYTCSFKNILLFFSKYWFFPSGTWCPPHFS